MQISHAFRRRSLLVAILVASGLTTRLGAQVSSTNAGKQQAGAVLVAPPGTASDNVAAQPVVLTIEGGGSLGVYEAGMTWAFVRLFKQQDSANRARQRNSALLPLRLAAVSGASAGSINALLAATSWCTRDSDDPPEKSPFWDTWVPTGLQQLLPQYNEKGWDAKGLFSRAYFEDRIFAKLKARWTAADWSDGCSVAVGATATRLVPESLTLPHASGVEAKTQRFSATFSVQVAKSADGRRRLSFKARPFDDLAETTIGFTTAEDGEIPVDSVLRIFEASSGYPVAFEPVPLYYRPSSPKFGAQFSDGGVFDNGPLGLGLSSYFGTPYWPVKLASDTPPQFPIAVYVAPDSRRIRADGRWEGIPGASQQMLVDSNARGLEPLFRLASGFVPSARTYELQQTMRTLRGIGLSRNSVSGDANYLLRVTTRWHPIVGDWLFGFAGFLGRPFREYDFYVGIYDAFAMVAGEICAAQPETRAAKNTSEECQAKRIQELIARPGFNLGNVAPEILTELWKAEFERGQSAATAISIVQQGTRPGTGKDVNLDLPVSRALVRGMAALMQDTLRSSRETATRLRQCGQGWIPAIVCSEGLKSVLDTIKADAAAMQVLRDARKDPLVDCGRKAPLLESDACLADERLMRLISDPEMEMDRIVQSFIERLVYRTPPGSMSYKVVAGLGFMHYSTNGSYRSGFDAGQTSLPPLHKSSQMFLWKALPSYATTLVGVQGAVLGWEARWNATSKLGIVTPIKMTLSQLSNEDSSTAAIRGWPVSFAFGHVVVAPVVGTAAEYKTGGVLSSVRLGENYWIPVNGTTSRDRWSTEASLFFFGGKLRTSLAQRPKGAIVNRTNSWIGEIGLGDVNGLIYWGKKIFH